MVSVGIGCVVVGLALFLGSLAMALRANPKMLVPYGRNAEIVPPRAHLLRWVGVLFTVAGAVTLATISWVFAPIVVLIGPFCALVAISAHNRAIARNAHLDTP